MSEYWKSNPRKFCDFCKCWIADNKPSVEFHERGKRHNENVQKRLEEIGKKGKEDHENKLKENDYMKEMEQAALKAYQKDIEANPDFTGTKIAELAEASNAKIVVSSKSSSEPPQQSNEKKKSNAKTTKPNNKTKWLEAKSPEGFSYYWNTETNESVWEAPSEGFTSVEEQKEQEEKRGQKSIKKKAVSSKPKKRETQEVPLQVFGPVPQSKPYGEWESAKPSVEEVDLQLPALPESEYYVPEVSLKRPKITFTEKVVTLSQGVSKGPVSFQKRKGAGDHKKNARRRVDD